MTRRLLLVLVLVAFGFVVYAHLTGAVGPGFH